MKIQLLLGAVVLALVVISIEGRSFPRRGGGRHHRHEVERGSRRRIQRICTQAPDSGVCFARKQMWFYNATSETCQTFTYGGCGGNRNRFYTEEGCMRRCSDPCTRPLDEGDECTDDSEPDATTRYYYDSEDNSCKEFEYTGCGGNTNRFRSLGYCQRRCVDREEEDSESSSDDDLFDSENDGDEDLFEEDDSEESSDSVDRRNRRSHSRIPRPRCQAAMCRLQCLYGQEVYTDGNGCIKCRCKQPVCPEVQRCAIVCEHGHEIDPTTGCETCACKDADSADDDDTDVDQLPEHCIGRPMCLMYCHFGFQKGKDGCPICACNAPPTEVEEIPKHCLGRIMCAMHCEHGFQRGDDGCPVCRCNPAPVALDLAVAVAGGGGGAEPPVAVAGGLGGTELRIRPNRCPLVRCMLACRYGFQRGEDGCPECRCNPPPTPRPLSDECPRFMCMMACQYGFQTDERGCTKCRCNPPPSPTPYPERCRNKPMCRMACPTGFETDDNGCPICRCKPFVPTLPDKCALRPMCRMWCEHGFQIGPDGCEICRCNGPPIHRGPIEGPRIEVAAAVGSDSLTQPLHTPQEEEEEEEEEVVRIVRRRRCPRFQCRRRCEFGFQKDEFGCDKCVCNAGPRVEFPEQCADRPACYRRCPNGFEVDDEGCPLCRCKREETRPTLPTPAPTCPPMIYCLIPCDFGSIPDENGCDTCNCLPEPSKCPKLTRRCAFGSILDENGCETYDCLPVACRSVYCFIPCLHGSIPDENGCETCNCLPAPTSTPPAEEPECPVQLKCFAPCPGGYKRDRNGCETCECLHPPTICRPIRCPKIFNCPFGYQLDAQGCQTCQCRSFNPTPEVSREETSAVAGVVHAAAAAGGVHAAAVAGGPVSIEGDVCSQPLKIGPCFGAIPRFYYNSSTAKCEMFRYGGCLGNGNNFHSVEGCREKCEMS